MGPSVAPDEYNDGAQLEKIVLSEYNVLLLFSDSLLHESEWHQYVDKSTASEKCD